MTPVAFDEFLELVAAKFRMLADPTAPGDSPLSDGEGRTERFADRGSLGPQHGECVEAPQTPQRGADGRTAKGRIVCPVSPRRSGVEKNLRTGMRFLAAGTRERS